jgi:hypothetical protein
VVINSSENKLRLIDNLDKHQKDLATTSHLFMSNFYSLFNGLLPKSFVAGAKKFLINLRLVPGDSKTRPSGSNSWNRFSFTSPRFMNKKRFDERLKRFPFRQQPVKI